MCGGGGSKSRPKPTPVVDGDPAKAAAAQAAADAAVHRANASTIISSSQGQQPASFGSELGTTTQGAA